MSSDSSAPSHSATAPQALTMTVHSLPQQGVLPPAGAERTRMGRWKMLLVLLVCAAPVVASYFTYYVVRPEGRTGFGELMDPQRPLPAVAATQLDGRPVPLESLRGQWLLVSVAPGACDARCEEHLYLQRQLREGLGREKERLDWVWLISDSQAPDAKLLPALEQGIALHVPEAELQKWLAPAAGAKLTDHLYVVDPQGHWMMRMPAQVDRSNAAKVKKDLERLLRASASWDKPGR